jgi:spore coat polysaccharide biosynthesis predicted glycosyltransferase SpsG
MEDMNRAPVLFRVDASPKLGWESLCRCLTYAQALQRRRRTAHFLSQLDPLDLVPTVKRGGNEWLEAGSPAGTPDDLDELLQEIRRLQPAAVVIDSSEVCETYLNSVRRTGVHLMTFDHHASRTFSTNLLVNPLLGPSKDDYAFTPRTQLLLGARYAIIRPEVRRLRLIRAQEPVLPFRALVALGDDDPNNQAGALAKMLLNCPKVARVDIAARPWWPHLEALKALAATSPDRLEIGLETNDVPTRIARCHFAITAGNSWSLELACVGVPQLVIVQNEAHWPTAQRLEEEGAAVCLGWHENVSATTIRQAVAEMLGDDLERQAMARAGRATIDGRGLDRLVNALEIVVNVSPLRGLLAEAA